MGTWSVCLPRYQLVAERLPARVGVPHDVAAATLADDVGVVLYTGGQMETAFVALPYCDCLSVSLFFFLFFSFLTKKQRGEGALFPHGMFRHRQCCKSQKRNSKNFLNGSVRTHTR